ncbi:MAG: hypothetical protein DRI24_13285 [Deltaproteobacteria bacterium]|nr:MAG: hypothetical protein DRI24_13285 [Deltaproteobacteria bacterium]
MLHNVEDLKALHIEVGYDETTTFGNYTITVQNDPDGESPREWDNLGTMVYWHRNYNLGDVDGSKEYSDPDMFWYDLAGIEDTDSDLSKAMELANKRNVILPLYLFDHSGITMSTSSFSCQWDSGQVGWIYVSYERIREEYSCKRVSAKMRKRIATYLENEVKTFDQFITNDIYGFNIERNDEDGEEVHIDSCWGFYGYDDPYMTEEVIKGAIQYDIENTPAQAELF